MTLRLSIVPLLSLWFMLNNYLTLVVAEGPFSSQPAFVPSSSTNYPKHSLKPSKSKKSAEKTESASETKETPKRRGAEIAFQGDSSASVEVDASAEEVTQWLMQPSQKTDQTLLGTTEVKQLNPEHDPTVWECLQPRIDFLGLDLQPSFTNRLERKDGKVTVAVIDSKTEVLKGNAANKIVANLMGRSKFSGQSIIQAKQQQQQPAQDSCTLSVDLSLSLNVPLPPFLPLPPGFNSMGSAIVSRTGKSRTKKLLDDLKRDYEEWASSNKQ